MGLIKMALNAAGSGLADQTVEVFECQNFDQKTLMRKATMRNAKNNKASDAYISSGSVFHVAINQAALLVEDGKVWVEAATCKGQDCVRMGVIEREGQGIACLPHRLVISIKGADQSGPDVIIK